MLGALEKDDFEDEVCAFLRRCMPDFQNIPAQPQGDGGLDGLSHAQTVGYCCYGPVQEPSKVKAKGLKSDIIKKFQSDLRTLCEVSPQGKSKTKALIHNETAELKTIMGAGRKLEIVRLVVSVFDTHQIVGALNTSFDEYKAASQCRFVEKGAKLTIWGPKELASMGAVDDLTLMRLEERAILRRVEATVASGAEPPPPSTTEFDAKFDWIETTGNQPPEVVKRLRHHFRSRWSQAIAIENDLANNAVTLHQAVNTARQEAAVDADLASGDCTKPAALLERMRQSLRQRLDEQTNAKFPPDLRNRIVDGEIARLLGECPVDWRVK